MSGDALLRSCVPLGMKVIGKRDERSALLRSCVPGMKVIGKRDERRRFVEILCATRDESNR